MRQVVLEPDSQAGGWVVYVPSLPGCVSEGETKEEALANIRDAIAGWIATAEDSGWDVPAEPFDVQVCVV